MLQYKLPQPHYHTTTTTISLPHPLSNLQYHNTTTTLPCQYHNTIPTNNTTQTLPLPQSLYHNTTINWHNIWMALGGQWAGSARHHIACVRNLCLAALNSQTAEVVHSCEFLARADYHNPRNSAVNEIRRPASRILTRDPHQTVIEFTNNFWLVMGWPVSYHVPAGQSPSNSQLWRTGDRILTRLGTAKVISVLAKIQLSFEN